jgi:predicted dithiol-disulfide oxidoreductase (DUF899 family)
VLSVLLLLVAHGTDQQDRAIPAAHGLDLPVVFIDRGEAWGARPGEQGGVSVFSRDGDTVLHTWSGYGAVSCLLAGTDLLLDLTPLGRQDESVELLHHGRYG